MDKNLKHTVTRFFYTLLHLTLMFCAAWVLVGIPSITLEALFDIDFNYDYQLIMDALIIVIVYTFIYKNNTLKVHTAWLTFILFLSIVSVLWYNVFLAYTIKYFTGSLELSHYSNFIYQIFLPFPLLIYISAFKSLRWFKILTRTIIILTILSILSFIIASPGGLKWLMCLLFAAYLL